MTNATGHPLLDTSAIDNDAWNRKTFEVLMALIGARKANEIAARFRSDLGDRFADVMNREAVRRDAHAVTSTAGMLGFAQLSQAARSLEAACESGEAFGANLQALMNAKFNATHALRSSTALGQTAM